MSRTTLDLKLNVFNRTHHLSSADWSRRQLPNTGTVAVVTKECFIPGVWQLHTVPESGSAMHVFSCSNHQAFWSRISVVDLGWRKAPHITHGTNMADAIWNVLGSFNQIIHSSDLNLRNLQIPKWHNPLTAWRYMWSLSWSKRCQ
jgi:hypothetical protein